MAIFKEIEKRLENLLEGFFTSQFRSGLEPVELARKLASEMDRRRRVGVTHTFASNVFRVSLSIEDHDDFEGFHHALLNELKEYLSAYGANKGYRFPGPIGVTLVADEDLQRGDCLLQSVIEEGDDRMAEGGTQIIPSAEVQSLMRSAPPAFLEDFALGRRYDLRPASTTIGRMSDNDIALADPSVSRRQARIECENGAYRLIDLNSTNGTSVNGQEIGQVRLEDGDEITFGRCRFIFRLQP